jgi:hypothetical protein
MNILAYILAAEEEFDWVHIVGLVLFIGIGLISSLFQKIKEKQKADKTAKPKTAARPKARKQTYQNQSTQPISPPPVRQQQSAAETVRVAQELELRQQRQMQLEAERRQRMATRQSPEADTQLIEARLVSVPGGQRAAEPEKTSEPELIPKLTNRSTAQQAMILHEIFSPPKALRQGGEMWDT